MVFEIVHDMMNSHIATNQQNKAPQWRGLMEGRCDEWEDVGGAGKHKTIVFEGNEVNVNG